MIEFPCTWYNLGCFKPSLLLGVAIGLSVWLSQAQALFRATLNLVLTIYIDKVLVGLTTNTKGVNRKDFDKNLSFLNQGVK